MADFQTVVNVYPARGIPGAYASVNPIVSTALGRIAGEDIPVGGFCWDDTSNEGQVKKTGTGKPLGFVVLERNYPIVTLSAAQNYVPKGFNVPVQVEGDFYVAVSAAVTKGQKVFVNNATGVITGAAAGSSQGGATETDWAFVTSADANGIAIISNYGATPAGGSGSVSYAETAGKLATARTITLSGTANGSTSFDGSQNVTITTTGE